MTILALVVVVGIGVFYALTLRHGHNWGDDFAMYISHARNIATGHTYTDTGYIYNPADPQIGPRAYPPGFPLLLSPVYLIWGLRLTPMKLELVAFFSAALFVCFTFFRRELSRVSSIALVLILGLNPFFWDYKDQVMSDVPFLFFVLIALVLIERHTRDGRPSPGWRSGLLIGIAIWAATSTRTVGLVLIPALVLAELFSFRRLTRHVPATLACFGLLSTLQLIVFGGGLGSYLDQAKPSVGAIQATASRTLLEFERLWGSGYRHSVMMAIFAVVTGLAIIGFAVRLKRGVTIFEIFPVLYAAPILLWPDSRGTRFWIPFIPFYAFFALVGIEEVARVVRFRFAHIGVAIITAALLFSYGAGYGPLDHGVISVGVGRPDTLRFFRFIRAHTPPHAVFVFARPRALALFTGHPASVYQKSLSIDRQWLYFQSIHAAYISEGPEDRGYLAKLLVTYAKDVTEVYRDGPFRIYRITGYS